MHSTSDRGIADALWIMFIIQRCLRLNERGAQAICLGTYHICPESAPHWRSAGNEFAFEFDSVLCEMELGDSASAIPSEPITPSPKTTFPSRSAGTDRWDDAGSASLSPASAITVTPASIAQRRDAQQGQAGLSLAPALGREFQAPSTAPNSRPHRKAQQPLAPWNLSPALSTSNKPFKKEVRKTFL